MLQGFEGCGFRENPAKDILTRLTLLSLRNNELADLPAALPAATVHNLRLLDISGNRPLEKRQPDKSGYRWHAENIAAFQCGWASLRVLGIVAARDPTSMRATAQKLQRLLQLQADAAQPCRRPAVVAFDSSDGTKRLLQPACNLAEIS